MHYKCNPILNEYACILHRDLGSFTMFITIGSAKTHFSGSVKLKPILRRICHTMFILKIPNLRRKCKQTWSKCVKGRVNLGLTKFCLRVTRKFDPCIRIQNQGGKNTPAMGVRILTQGSKILVTIRHGLVKPS